MQRLFEPRQRRIPLWTPLGSNAKNLALSIIDGQTVYSSGGTTYYGVAKQSGTMTQVTSLWDPSTATTAGTFTAQNGIGRAALYANGVFQSNVLVVHDSRVGNLMGFSLANGDVCGTFTTASLTLVSDPTKSVLVYCPTAI